MSAKEIFKKEFSTFKCLKETEKKFVLCSIIGRIDRKILLSLELSLEPHSIDFHKNSTCKSVENSNDNLLDGEGEIERVARHFVNTIIESSVEYLKNEYFSSKSFDKYLLRDNSNHISVISIPSVNHSHISRLPREKHEKKRINHNKKELIFKTFDATSLIIWLCSEEFKDDQRKMFVTELLFTEQYEVMLHICLCVNKRLEERWSAENIPENILLAVFRRLSSEDLLKVSLVCKRWHKISRNNSLWKRNCSRFAQQIGLRKITDVVAEHLEEEETRINWFEIYKTFRKFFSNYKPKKASLKIDRLSFLKERLPEPPKQVTRPTKAVKLSPIKEDVAIRTTNVFLRRTSRSTSLSDPNPDNDKRQLMKPILGHLKQFQNSDEFAIDCRSSHLSSLADSTNHLESKIELKWIDTSISTHNAGKASNQKPVKKMVYIGNCFRLTGHLDGVTSLKCDRLRLASSSLDGTIRIWDSVSGRSIRKMVGHKGGIYCLDFNEHMLVSGGWDMSLIVWSLCPNFNVIKVLYGHKDTITSLKIVEEKELIISASMDGTLRYYDRQSFKLTKVVTFNAISSNSSGIRDMRLEIAVNAIVTAHNDCSIRLTDIDREQSTIVVGTQADIIRALFLQSQLLISGGSTGYLQFWEIDMICYKCISKARLQIKTDSNLPLSIESIAYFSRSLWTGHDDGTIKEWHLSSMTCLRTIMGHKGAVKQICFIENSMVTASLDSSIRMWKMSLTNNESQSMDKYGNFRERVPISFIFK